MNSMDQGNDLHHSFRSAWAFGDLLGVPYPFCKQSIESENDFQHVLRFGCWFEWGPRKRQTISNMCSVF